MTRINPVNNPEGKAAELYEAVTGQLGMVPNIFKTFANSPAVLEGFLNFNAALSGGALDAKLREQIALTVAGSNGCDYCASAHTLLGKGAGLAESELTAGLNGESSDAKSQAALTFSRSIVANRGNVSDTELQTVRDAGFNEAEIVEIIAHTAVNIFTNYFNEIAGTEIDFPVVNTDLASRVA